MLTQESALRKDRTNAHDASVLQHRHFAFIAGVIAAMPTHAATLRTQKRSIALAFADACLGGNARFDRERFLRACGEVS